LLWSLIYISGPVIAILNPNIEPSNNAMIWAALNVMPTLVGALLLAGIVAAGLSSASTFLTLVGFAISNDVIDESASSDAQRLRISRITILAVGLVTLVLAMFVPPDIYWITNFVGPMFAAVWGPVAFMSVWSKRISEPAAFWGMVAGFVAFVGPKTLTTLSIITLPSYFNPLLLGFIASLITVLAVSRNTTVSTEEAAYRDALHVAPPELSDPVANRRTMMWPKIMIVWGAVLSLILVVVYVRPHQLAKGQLTDSSFYVVWSDELLIALLFGAFISVAGLLARRIILRDGSNT
jgi:Na+/proline symporter